MVWFACCNIVQDIAWLDHNEFAADQENFLLLPVRSQCVKGTIYLQKLNNFFVTDSVNCLSLNLRNCCDHSVRRICAQTYFEAVSDADAHCISIMGKMFFKVERWTTYKI